MGVLLLMMMMMVRDRVHLLPIPIWPAPLYSIPLYLTAHPSFTLHHIVIVVDPIDSLFIVGVVVWVGRVVGDLLLLILPHCPSIVLFIIYCCVTLLF